MSKRTLFPAGSRPGMHAHHSAEGFLAWARSQGVSVWFNRATGSMQIDADPAGVMQSDQARALLAKHGKGVAALLEREGITSRRAALGAVRLAGGPPPRLSLSGGRSPRGSGRAAPPGIRRVSPPAPTFDDDEWEDEDDDEAEALLELARRGRPAPSRTRSTTLSRSHLDDSSSEELIAAARALQRAFRRDVALRRARTGSTRLASRYRRELLERAGQRLAIKARAAGRHELAADERTVQLAIGRILGDRGAESASEWNGRLPWIQDRAIAGCEGFLRGSWLEVERVADEIAAGEGPRAATCALSYQDQLAAGWRDYGALARANPFGRKDEEE